MPCTPTYIHTYIHTYIAEKRIGNDDDDVDDDDDNINNDNKVMCDKDVATGIYLHLPTYLPTSQSYTSAPSSYLTSRDTEHFRRQTSASVIGENRRSRKAL